MTARNAVLAAADPDARFERGELRQIAVAAEAEHLPRYLSRHRAQAAERLWVTVEADHAMGF